MDELNYNSCFMTRDMFTDYFSDTYFGLIHSRVLELKGTYVIDIFIKTQCLAFSLLLTHPSMTKDQQIRNAY